MSAPRRDSSQSPDPTSGHGMGGLTKNGGDLMQNGPVLQPGEYDQWHTQSIYSPNGGFGPLTSTQPTQIPGDYVTNYYTASPYDHHASWTATAPAGFYHQGLSPPVSSPYMDHLTFFGPPTGGNSFYYNYFPTPPTNGSDYNAWGGPSIITTARTSASGGNGGGNGSKHSEFYYPMTDGGYTHYVGTDIVGGNTNGDGRLNAGQPQFGYLEQGVAHMSVYDDPAIPGVPAKIDQNVGSGPYGGGSGAGGSAAPAVRHGGGSSGPTLTQVAAGEPKKKSWANIASQPAKPNSGGGIGGTLLGGGKARGRVPIGGVPGSASLDSGGGASPNFVDSGGFWGASGQVITTSVTSGKQDDVVPSNGSGNYSQRSYGGGLAKGGGSTWSAKPTANYDGVQSQNGGGTVSNGNENGDCVNDVKKDVSEAKSASTTDKSDSQKQRKSAMENNYNPKEFTMPAKGARYFVIKSYSEDDIHRSIKYGIWCSTEHGNKRLDGAYREREGKGPIFLLFSVNGSGHFCGVAQMTSPLDYNKSSGVWAQDKWKGQFTLKWIYVKDVPNAQLRHIRLENNENKPVTNSRDTQEVPPEKGRQVLKIVHQYRHTTSLFDDFGHYEKRQEEEDQRKARRANVDE